MGGGGMTRALVIVEAAHLVEARGLLLGEPFHYTPEMAAGTFVPAGSMTGEEPATHYWLSAQMSPVKWAACQALAAARAWAWCFDYDLESEPDFADLTLEALGLQRLTPEVGV